MAEFAKHEVPKNLEKEFTNMPTPFNTPQVRRSFVLICVKPVHERLVTTCD